MHRTNNQLTIELYYLLQGFIYTRLTLVSITYQNDTVYVRQYTKPVPPCIHGTPFRPNVNQMQTTLFQAVQSGLIKKVNYKGITSIQPFKYDQLPLLGTNNYLFNNPTAKSSNQP